MQTATTCPNCGVKLPEQPLSLCAYCAMPLGLDGAPPPSGAESPNAARIARIEEHDNYPAALAVDPPESREYQLGARDAWRARLVLGLAALVLVAILVLSDRAFVQRLWAPGALLAYALVGLAIYLHVQGRAAQRRALGMPLLKRPGLIVDRRSETELSGWSGHTTYYFTIEFSGGVVGEFAFPGHGAHEDPYVTNLPGVAYTRGPTLLAFKHVRV